MLNQSDLPPISAIITAEIPVFRFTSTEGSWEIKEELKIKQLNDTQSAPISIAISNGDLMFSSWPVMMGHFNNDGLFSAERVADKYLEGALSRDHKLDIYPGSIGSAKLFRQGADNPFKGALIIGLGSAEELNAYQLALSIEKAVCGYLLQEPVTGQQELGLSTLLIGADYGGLSVENSCRAILQGVFNANQKVKSLDSNERSLVTKVEFLEIFEDKAIQAFYILDDLVNNNSDGLPLKINKGDEGIRQIPGVLRRLITDNTSSWWQRLSVQATTNDCQPGEKRFSFYSSTNNAREERQSIYTQLGDIETLLDEISRQKQWSYEKARTIFEMTIPNDFKESIRRNSPIIWVLDLETAAIPWELLQTGNRSEFPLCVSSGMIRQLSTSFYKPVANAIQSNQVLLIANPDTGHSDYFPELEGTVIEISEVARQLGSLSWLDIQGPLIKSSASEIQIAFFSQQYKIIHFAGHGVYHAADPQQTGLVIGINKDTGQPILFSPAKFNQFTNAPELVFINACYGGTINTNAEELVMSRHKLAANIGTQLINLGVKAVVIAGWEVDDAAARLFAEVFYAHMVNGYNFGDAVLYARKRTYQAFGDTNTWGAYQCYGQPYYMLHTQSAKSGTKKKYRLPQEAENDLNNLLSGIDIAFKSDADLLKELKVISSLIRESKMNVPSILEKEAQAYLDLDEIEEALRLYQQIFDSKFDDFRIRSLEKYQDITIKQTVKLLRIQIEAGTANKETHELSKNKIKIALNNLINLYNFHNTGRLHLMIASAYKRLAYISSGQSKLKYLGLYRDEYRIGFELIQSPYALQNWLSAELILHFAARQPMELKYLKENKILFYENREILTNEFSQKLRSAQQRITVQRRKVTFYDESDKLDLRLTEYLLKAEDYKKSGGEYLQGMKLLWRKSVSKNKKARQVENLRIFRSMLQEYGQDRFATKIIEMENKLANN